MRKIIYVLIVVVVALALWAVFGPRQVSAPATEKSSKATSTQPVSGNDQGMPDTGVLPN